MAFIGALRSHGRVRVVAGAVALVAVAGLVAAVVTTDAVDPLPAGPLRPDPPAVPAEAGGGGATLRPVDGGPDYYARFSPSLPTDPSYFPLAVWFESVHTLEEVAYDKAAGLNLYVELTEDSDLSVVREGGMQAIIQIWKGEVGPEVVGWFVSDEADMWGGAGHGPWSWADGDTACHDEDQPCGYTMQEVRSAELPQDNRLRYTNYGKGVVFWLSDEEAAKFVNEYQDVISADVYWFTQWNACDPWEGGVFYGGEELAADVCHRAVNYGKTIDRVRSLVDPPGSKPVWAHIELGHPWEADTDPQIKPAEIVAATWSSLIHGARGVIYFNHSFGGECISYHILREECYAEVRATVTALNARITRLAPVLNAPFADGIATVEGSVDISVKWYDGNLYVLAGSTEAPASEPKRATIKLPCVGDATVTVLDEGRSVPVKDGSFTDEFADGNAVHIYRIDGGSSCGLR